VHAQAALAVAEKLRDRTRIEGGLARNASVAFVMGDWQTARAFNDRGIAIAPSSAIHLWRRVVIEFQVGDFPQGQAYLQRLIDAMSLVQTVGNFQYALPTAVIPLVARMTGDVRHYPIAEAAAHKILALPSVIPQIRGLARASLALIAEYRADAAGAAEQYDALQVQRGTMFGYGSIASVDRVLGILAQTMGQLDKAAEHFEAAIAFCRKAGYRPELAWSCCDYADMLLQRSGPGDRQKAMSLLDESLRISRELGMRPLMERVLSRRKILRA
jgi:tetratricopeptide (TPR) repeat protein